MKFAATPEPRDAEDGETGTAQPDAIRFYEREGYRLIDSFGPYAGLPLSVCYARSLA
jgi:putative acetyltransferase